MLEFRRRELIIRLVRMLTNLALASMASVPTFPSSFYMGEQLMLLINQGGVESGSDKVCCAASSPSCRVEAQFTGQDYYEDAANNRSRVDSAQGDIVRWYQIASPQFPHDGMQMAVTETAPGSPHKYECASYCPLEGAKFESLVAIGDKESGRLGVPHDLGRANVTQAPPARASAECEHWQWRQGLDAPKHNWSVVMSQEDFFVRPQAAGGAPFLHRTIIEPFGNYMGESNASFLTFTPMNITDHFDIDPASMKTCKGASSCGDDDTHTARGALRASHRVLGRSLLSLAHESLGADGRNLPRSRAFLADTRREGEEARTVASTVAADAHRRLSDRADVDMPLDYVSHETTTMRQAQGAQITPSGDACCARTSPGCQVQLQHFEGVRYFDCACKRIPTRAPCTHRRSRGRPFESPLRRAEPAPACRGQCHWRCCGRRLR